MDNFQPIEHGFESDRQMHQMIAKVDLSAPHKIDAFKRWQYQDGTKDALQRLIDSQEG